MHPTHRTDIVRRYLHLLEAGDVDGMTALFAPDGQVFSLGCYFSSPGFTDERGYFFLARPVRPCEEGPNCDEGESILDCRQFNVEEIRRMIADNEIRDANTLGICAMLVARGLLSLAPH